MPDKIITKTLVADVDRYGGIATRWPSKIVVTGTEAQIEYFETHGIYEAGCDDLYTEPTEVTGAGV